MSPPITVSIARIGPHHWVLGSSMVCERVRAPELIPADAVIDWQDGDNTFYLRSRTAADSSRGDPEVDRVHVGGTSAAVWCLGENAFCKVHAWCEGLELEANTIRFVGEVASEVPLPEVIYSWINPDLNRTFLITKRVKGQTLERMWPRLSETQRAHIAHGIARFCVILAANTSSQFETVTGCGVYEARFMESAPSFHPTWLPRCLGTFSLQAIRAHMINISTEPPPEVDPTFHFYHADLGPTNIIISEDGNLITGITDWESAAYYPQFWLATKPLYAGAFWLECETDEPKLWGKVLGEALLASGYERQDSTFRSWSKCVT